MANAKIEVNLTKYPNKDGKIYSAIAFRGGYATKHFLLDKINFEIRFSFYNVLFNYLSSQYGSENIQFEVNRSASVIKIASVPEKMSEDINTMLDRIYSLDISEEEFNVARKNVENNFSNGFKNSDFRAYYKSLEYTDINKGYTLDRLTHDILDITYEEFKKSYKNLIVPGNTVIYIVGDADEKMLAENLNLNFEIEGAERVLTAGFDYDPYLKMNSGIVNIDDVKDTFLMVESIDFVDKETKLVARQIVAEVLAMSLKEIKIGINVDPQDTSIAIYGSDAEKYKSKLNNLTEEDFEFAKNRIIENYRNLLNEYPMEFVADAGVKMANYVLMDYFLKLLQDMDYETFRDIYKKSGAMINEAQIIIRKVG